MTDPEIELAREEDRQFFRANPSRRFHLRHAWPSETRDCNHPADMAQRWFIIATQYNDGSLGWHSPFLANHREIAAAVDDISVHRLQTRMLESAGYTSSSAPSVN